MASAVLQGLLIGLVIAASPGPVFFLCVRRTLARGFTCGAVSGLGVATADGLYAAIAGFGVAAVTAALVAHARWVSLAGGIVILGLGLRTLATPLKLEAAAPRPGAGDYLSVLALTLANPPTLLSFAAVIAGLGLRPRGGTALLVLGVFLGSAAWWIALAAVIASLRRRVTYGLARALGVGSGAALAGLGLIVIGSALHLVVS